MMVLEKAFSRFHTAEFYGFMIAKADFYIHSEHLSKAIDLKILRKRADGAVLEVSETPSCRSSSYIKIILLKPGTGESLSGFTRVPAAADDLKKMNASEYSDVGRLLSYQKDIGQFLELTGDRNPIHQGVHPVVPGFCLLNHTLELLGRKPPLIGSIRFLQPTFAGEQLHLYRKPQGIWAVGPSGTAFILKLRKVND